MRPQMSDHDALLIVDAQIDFFPGGALAVPEGDSILPTLLSWLEVAIKQDIPIIASRDWHPSEHSSFTQQGGPWPSHCVQGTRGAEFHPDIPLPANTILISKGYDPDQDHYSAFQGRTDENETLEKILHHKKIQRLFICGLTQDYCVLASALDASKLGFKVHVILSGTRAITPEAGKEALKKMREAGVIIEKN